MTAKKTLAWLDDIDQDNDESIRMATARLAIQALDIHIREYKRRVLRVSHLVGLRARLLIDTVSDEVLAQAFKHAGL